MRLDFTNDRLNKWISECPFPIDVKQSMVEPTGCRQLNIAVTIPDTLTLPTELIPTPSCPASTFPPT